MLPYNLPLSCWSTKVHVYKSKRKIHIFKLLSDRCNQSLKKIMSANNVLFFPIDPRQNRWSCQKI